MLNVIKNSNLYLSSNDLKMIKCSPDISWGYGVGEESDQLTGKLLIDERHWVSFVVENNKIKDFQKHAYPYIFTRLQWHQDEVCHRDNGPASIHYDQTLKQRVFFWYRQGRPSSYRNISVLRQINGNTKEVYFVNTPNKPISIEKIFYFRAHNMLIKSYYINDNDLFLPCYLGFGKNKSLVSANFSRDAHASLELNQSKKLELLAKEYNINLFKLEKQQIHSDFCDMLKINFLQN